ncbi:MAG: DUF5668 domain-containing protein [Anaerolineales bacterium]
MKPKDRWLAKVSLLIMGMDGVNSQVRNRMLLGLLFVAAGITALLSELGVFPTDGLKLWPILLIVMGLWLSLSAVGTATGRGFTGGLIVIGVGAYFLAENLKVIPDGLFLSILLVALGLGLVLRPMVSNGSA